MVFHRWPANFLLANAEIASDLRYNRHPEASERASRERPPSPRNHEPWSNNSQRLRSRACSESTAPSSVTGRVCTWSLRGPAGERAIGIDDFFLLPGDTPEREHPLEHGELIYATEVPATPVARRSVYLKFRDRESYEFALASVAAAVRIEDGTVAEVRLALGGVGTKPWRARRAAQTALSPASASLIGRPATGASFAEAARQELAMARPRPLNAFKVELAQRAIVRALTTLTDGEPR